MALKRIYQVIAKTYFILATVALLVLAFVIMSVAIIDVIQEFSTPGLKPTVVLQSVGLLIIGFAIVETSNFIAEEEIFQKRELRSSSESRQSLTGFVTIIVIASSLEALVMIFSASRLEVANTIYAAVIFFVAMFSLICLGAYQWLSSRIRADNGSLIRTQ